MVSSKETSKATRVRSARIDLVPLLKRILEAITSRAKREQLLALVTQGTVLLCGVAMAAVSLVDDSSQDLEVVSVYGSRGAIHGTRLPVSGSLNGRVVLSGRTFHCPDIDKLPPELPRGEAQGNDVRGLCIVPLRWGDRVIGTLAAASSVPWRCTADQELLLKLMADIAAITVELAKGTDARPDSVVAGYSLSSREREILLLLVADCTHKQIADATGLSERTVGHYIERLKIRFRKSTMHGLVGDFVTRRV